MAAERERTRVCSKVDELPEEARTKLDQMLAMTGEDYMKYQEISDELSKMGYAISKSSIGRYAIKNNSAIKRLKEARIRTEALLDAVKDNQDIHGTEIATALFVDQLVQRMATAEDDIENLPIEKAAKLMIAIQRSAVYKEKFKMQFNKGYKQALLEVKAEFIKELKENEPELLTRIIEVATRLEKSIEQKAAGD
ncbi:MAG: DUF3486 family protein [Bacillota bacterium]|nr:DUF3486 family protein [Bacillota bacterium]